MINGSADEWDEIEALLIKACDEIVGDHFVSDATGAGLATRFPQSAQMYVVFTIAQYVQISTLLNSFGVQGEQN